MKKDEVPQDQVKSLGGQRKLLYAVDEGGDYTRVVSAGWEAEDFATLAAVNEIDRMRDEALARARGGQCSTLEYHMYARRMEPATLSAAMGYPGWRLRRHFQPAIFAKLPKGMLARYAETLGISIEELRSLPEAGA